MYTTLRISGDAPPSLERGRGILNRNQKAAARQLSLAAYLLFAGGRAKDEAAIRENLPPYGHVYDSSLGEDENRDRAGDALRKQLKRDVETLAGAGIKVEVEGDTKGRRYWLPPGGFSPAELDLSTEERAVLVGALRALRRDFPYAGPLRLAVANLIGAASGSGNNNEDTEEARVVLAAVATRNDDAVAQRVAALENAIASRRRVRFEYYSISGDEVSEREVEPYTLSLLEGLWYVSGWDTDREALRQFRLSRIRGRVTFATRRERGDYEIPENFERRFAGPRAPWQLGEPDRTARIRVSSEAFAAARQRYLWAVSLGGREETGERVLSTRYSGERQLAAWILSLADDALALSPPSLVERVVEGLERIVGAHGPGGPEPEEERT